MKLVFGQGGRLNLHHLGTYVPLFESFELLTRVRFDAATSKPHWLILTAELHLSSPSGPLPALLSTALVPSEGIEPPYDACKTPVLPLN